MVQMCQRMASPSSSPGTSPGNPGTPCTPESPEQFGSPGSPVRNRPIRPIERQKMRDWLMDLLDSPETSKQIAWTSRKTREFRIIWKHGSGHGWSRTRDTDVFERWAKHTGRYSGTDSDPKRWKANFRCALNSVPDIEELKDKEVRKGPNAFRVFRFVDKKDKSEKKKKTKEGKPGPRTKRASRSESSDSHTDSMSLSSCSMSQGSINEEDVDMCVTSPEEDDHPKEEYMPSWSINTDRIPYILPRVPDLQTTPLTSGFEFERSDVLPKHLSGCTVLRPKVSTKPASTSAYNNKLPDTTQHVQTSQSQHSQDSETDDGEGKDDVLQFILDQEAANGNTDTYHPYLWNNPMTSVMEVTVNTTEPDTKVSSGTDQISFTELLSSSHLPTPMHTTQVSHQQHSMIASATKSQRRSRRRSTKT